MRTNILQSALVLAAFLFSVSVTSAQEEETNTEFSEITGKVVDSSGQPIEEFKVTITVNDYSDGWGKQPKKAASWEGSFTNGEFQFDVEESIPINRMTYVSHKVTVEGYMEINQNSLKQIGQFSGKFGKLKMFRGIKLKGKLTMPDSMTDEEMIGPRLAIMKKQSGMLPNYNEMFHRYCQVQKDGSFEMMVPEDCKLFLTARSENAATQRKEFKIKKYAEVNDGEQDLGEIKLKEGITVSGIVLSKGGEPVEGQVVKISQTVGNSNYMVESVDGYAVSDSQGKFTLPPRLGKSNVSLVDTGTVKGTQVKVKGKKLLVKPVKMTLNANQPVDEVEIRESNTWRIHGVITSKDTSSQPNVYASVPGDSQNEVELDSDGNFEFEMVDGAECYLMIYQNSGEGVYMAKMSPESIRAHRKHFRRSPADESQFFHLNEVTSDIGPLEFTMRKRVPDERTFVEQMVEWWIYGD